MVKEVKHVPLTDAQRELAGRPEHVAMALSIATRYAAKWPPAWADDIRSAGLYGLMVAARKYRPELSEFTTYAATCVLGAIRDYVRDVEMSQGMGFGRVPQGRKTQFRVVVLSKPVAFDSSRTVTLAETIEAAGDSGRADFEFRDLVAGLTKRLPKKHAEVVRRYVLDSDATMAQIGRDIGRSESRVSQILSDAMKQIREQMGERE